MLLEIKDYWIWSEYGSPVIWTLWCSSGQVSNPTPDYRVSVMSGLHWTHVWNRRSEDTVTYRRLKLSSGASLTRCWGGNYTKCHRIHLTQIWCLVIFHFVILWGKINELWLWNSFEHKLEVIVSVWWTKCHYMGKNELQDSYINQFLKLYFTDGW